MVLSETMMLSPENRPRMWPQSTPGSIAVRMSSAMMMLFGLARVTRPFSTPLIATRPFT